MERVLLYIILFLFTFFSCSKVKDVPIDITDFPIANAGSDQAIILPATKVILDGSGSSDPNNRPLLYSWTKISGGYCSVPPSFYQKTNIPIVEIDCYSAGEYVFELIVTNSTNLSSRDLVKITVTHSPSAVHTIDMLFDLNQDCKITGEFPGTVYAEALFSLSAASSSSLSGGNKPANIYARQDYEKYSTVYFYRPSVGLSEDSLGSISFLFSPGTNFYLLPYNSGPVAFSDSITVMYGTGIFGNITRGTSLLCTGVADTAHHTGKIRLQGSLYY